MIYGKLEGNNPAGSIKDRPAIRMIKDAEDQGMIKKGDTLIEATSGNTGIALAMAASIKGFKIKLIMPETASVERIKTMKAYGADYIMGMMSKQGELSEAAEGALYREGLDQMLIGKIDREALQVDMPKQKSSTVDPAIFRMADEKDY